LTRPSRSPKITDASELHIGYRLADPTQIFTFQPACPTTNYQTYTIASEAKQSPV
jgi:hypothetical protein